MMKGYSYFRIAFGVLLVVFAFAGLATSANLTTEQIMNASFDPTASALKVQWSKNDAEIVSALTNAVQNVFDVKHTTSGTPANGIGAGLTFTQETSAANNEIGMIFQALATDTTAGSEDFSFILKLMKAGAAASTALSVTSTGVLTLVNDETIDNTVNGTITYTATTHAFTGAMTVSSTLGIGGALTLSNAETISNGTNGQIDLNGDVYINGATKLKSCTIAADDATPDVAGCSVLVTSANNAPTAITDLDNPVVGAIYYIVGGSDTNSTTIADAGNFALTGGFTAGAKDILALYCIADNNYAQISVANN